MYIRFNAPSERDQRSLNRRPPIGADVVNDVDVVPLLIERAEANRIDRLLARGLEVEPRRSPVLEVVVGHVRDMARIKYVMCQRAVAILLA